LVLPAATAVEKQLHYQLLATSTSIAGLGNLSIRDTATMSVGNAAAAIQNEF
jgi:hypothetical protein